MRVRTQLWDKPMYSIPGPVVEEGYWQCTRDYKNVEFSSNYFSTPCFYFSYVSFQSTFLNNLASCI